MAKRTVKEIIEDWVFSVWKVELPRTFQGRRDAYYRLFGTLKEEGYGWDDVSSVDDKYIKSFTVGKKGTGQQRADWNEYADKHLLDAKISSFGTRGKISESKPLPPQTEQAAAPSSEQKPAEDTPKETKLKEHVPNPRELEKIDKMFKFEFTDEDIE